MDGFFWQNGAVTINKKPLRKGQRGSRYINPEHVSFVLAYQTNILLSTTPFKKCVYVKNEKEITNNNLFFGIHLF